MQWAYGTIFLFHCSAKYICILWYTEETTMVFKRTWDDLVGKGTYHKNLRSEFNSHNLCYGRREMIPELYALASIHGLWHTRPHIQKINKLGKEEKEMGGGGEGRCGRAERALHRSCDQTKELWGRAVYNPGVKMRSTFWMILAYWPGLVAVYVKICHHWVVQRQKSMSFSANPRHPGPLPTTLFSHTSQPHTQKQDPKIFTVMGMKEERKNCCWQRTELGTRKTLKISIPNSPDYL